MRIVFHGESASAYSDGFANLLNIATEIDVLEKDPTTPSDRETYASAEVIVSFTFNRNFPRPEGLRLFHVPGAGYDAIDFDFLPAEAIVCNCFGHEQPIAEYVMAALLGRYVPLLDADRRLRNADWGYRAGSPDTMHEELAGKTIGLLGFGHIGSAVAVRAKAFDMRVHVANRSLIPVSPLVDQSFMLEDLHRFWPSADFFVVSVPLAPETKGIVSFEAFAAMRPTAVLINVGRGQTVDEAALFEALHRGKIAGAIIDVWYNYPSATLLRVQPSTLPFNGLPNIVMTPHMSGWTRGTVRRRQQTIADNIKRRMRNEPCINIVRPARLRND